MRLTNVSQMEVQPGRLHSCVVTATPEDTELLPLSFDQRRHVSFGSRPGSWMAVSFRLPHPTGLEQIAEAWEHVLGRHGTLRSVFTCSEGSGDQGHPEVTGEKGAQLRLNRVEPTESQWETLARDAGPAEIRATLRELFDVACDPFAQPSHRLCVVEPSPVEAPPAEQGAEPASGRQRQAPVEQGPQIIIGSDHSHVDAWSLLVLIRDLTSCLEDLDAGRPLGARLPEAEPFSAHTRHMAAKSAPPEEITTRWREILDAGGGAMPNFPLNLGDLSTPAQEVVEVRDVFDAEELAFLEGHAAEHGVRLIAVAVSVMTRLARQLADQPLRTVFPVHSREDPRWFDSVGWFITNSVLENDDDSYAASYRTVKEAIRLGSYPLGPIMEPYGGMPQEPGMFAMSWLDHRKLPVNVAEDLQPQHVSAVIRTDGVMIWFVINDSGMHLRCRYPDTRQARRAMRTWLAGLVYGLRAPLERG